jgi:Ca-activated chloride channel family protein
MVRQIETQPAVGSRQLAARSHAAFRRPAACCLMSVLSVFMAMTALSDLKAESLASQNKKGNRLFAQGKYEDAEKAYLNAQAKSPGKPEILYNLGNSLIKQKKYNQGIQSLRQSMGKGDKGIKENSWYNTGNALFSMGSFKESADAFKQALKLDPADRNAKHNLELALLKLQEQKQSGENQRQQSSANQNQSGSGKENQEAQAGKDRRGNQKEQNEPSKPQIDQANQQAGSMSKEQALQILQALQSQELAEQRKLMERRSEMRIRARDW